MAFSTAVSPDSPRSVAPDPLTAAILQLPPPQESGRTASGQSVRAMQALMALVTEVRSPENGWDANTPATPEAIAPYVADEACDLLEALEAGTDNDPVLMDAPESSPPTALWAPYCTLDSLTPKLLWGLARSAVEVMRLLESVSATVAPAGTTRQRGLLRLAAVLELHAEESTQRHDLVMHSPRLYPAPLAADAQIWELDGTAVTPARTVGEVLEAIAQQVELSTPALSALLVGMPMQLLLPEHDWQPATLRLHLELEFLPGALPPSLELLTAPTADLAQSPASAADMLPTMLQFTPGAWLQRYCTHISDQALAQRLLNLAGCRTVAEAVFPLPAEEIVPRLVADASLLV
ncbi:MAG: hypothetical protein D6742_14840, partial [Cyanobacteria bacterium J069]